MTEGAGWGSSDPFVAPPFGPTADPGGPAQPGKRRFGRGRWTLVGLMVVFFAIAAYAWVQVLPAALNTLTKPAMATPATDDMHLDAGHYGIYERTGTQTGGAGLTFTMNGPSNLSPDDVTITGPSGVSVAVRYMSDNETINRNGAIYTGALEFEATEAGRYRVTITRVRSEVIVARTLFDGQATHVVVGAISGFAFLLTAAALVIATIVSASRRRRAERAAAWPASPAFAAPSPPMFPPPAAYPPPPPFTVAPPPVPPPPPPYPPEGPGPSA